jgi:PleD family two-component response regulator
LPLSAIQGTSTFDSLPDFNTHTQMAREKILVVDHDLDNLSRIYLALLHRGFKVEACNQPEEIIDRLKRFKPAVIVVNSNDYKKIMERLKIPAVVLSEIQSCSGVPVNDGDVLLKKPVHADALVKAVETLV